MTIQARCKHCGVTHRFLKLQDGCYERVSKSALYCACEPLPLTQGERMVRELATMRGARKRR